MRLPRIVIFSFLIFAFYLIFPNKSLAAFDGGINIGPHLDQFERAAQLADWVYVMIYPEQIQALIDLWNKYPDTNLVIRGHFPDSQGSSLTAEEANKWAQALSLSPRTVYFMPVNEPNNPNESQNVNGQGGISATVVSNYITALQNAGIFDKENIRVLSPAIDVYTMADGPNYQSSSNYAKQLGPNFFNQFDGIALNLYGQFRNGELDTTANKVKQGEYKDFIRDYLGITGSSKIFAVETGVKKVEDAGVKYKENREQIVDYFNLMKDQTRWGGDPNFVMFSIFSYDPADFNSAPWIYDDLNVLAAMDLPLQSQLPTLTPLPTQIVPRANSPIFSMFNITKKSNERLLPQNVQQDIRQKAVVTKCVGGISVPVLGICAFGEFKEVPVTANNVTAGDLASETENFQPYYMPQEKVVSVKSQIEKGDIPAQGCDTLDFECRFNEVKNNLLGFVVVPQQSNKLTGSLNTYVPSNLNPQNDSVLGVQNGQNSNSQVLAESTNPQEELVNSYNFTSKMLLPNSIGSVVIADSTPVLSPPPNPSISPNITPSVSPPVFPSTTPFKPPEYRCSTGKEYCSIDFLKDYFPAEAVLEASMICNAESGSNPYSVNKNCLRNKTLDYSIGLFQINLLVHCPDSEQIFEFEYGEQWCTVLDQEKADACEQRFLDPLENIRYAVDLYNKSGWDPWSTADYCGIDTN